VDHSQTIIPPNSSRAADPTRGRFGDLPGLLHHTLFFTEDWREISNGAIADGKMTTPRSGKMGSSAGMGSAGASASKASPTLAEPDGSSSPVGGSSDADRMASWAGGL